MNGDEKLLCDFCGGVIENEVEFWAMERIIAQLEDGYVETEANHANEIMCFDCSDWLKKRLKPSTLQGKEKITKEISTIRKLNFRKE